jgi:hypothetical protein
MGQREKLCLTPVRIYRLTGNRGRDSEVHFDARQRGFKVRGNGKAKIQNSECRLGGGVGGTVDFCQRGSVD